MNWNPIAISGKYILLEQGLSKQIAVSMSKQIRAIGVLNLMGRWSGDWVMLSTVFAPMGLWPEDWVVQPSSWETGRLVKQIALPVSKQIRARGALNLMGVWSLGHALRSLPFSWEGGKVMRWACPIK